MELTFSENLFWALGTAMEVLLCVLVFYRRLYRRLPFFSFYSVLLVVQNAVVWSVYREWGFLSHTAWYTYWSASLVELFVLALVVAELCWTSMRSYPAIWSLVRKLLALVALVVLTYAAVVASRANSPIVSFVRTVEQGLEVSLLAVLVALLGFGARYQVPLGPVERSIAIGIGIYSGFQVVNDTAMNHWMTQYFHWWNLTHELSFDVAMLVWMIPLRKALPAAETAPTLISEEAAIGLLRELLATMRDLTDELKRIAKSIWK